MSKVYPNAKQAMEARAERAVWRGGGRLPDEDLAAAVTVTGNLRAAYRVLREGEERGEFVRNGVGFLDFPPEHRENPVWQIHMEEDE